MQISGTSLADYLYLRLVNSVGFCRLGLLNSGRKSLKNSRQLTQQSKEGHAVESGRAKVGS